MFKYVAGVGAVEMTPAEVAARVAEEIIPPSPLDQLWADLRAERNARLSACDWTQLSDAPVDQAAWATYRQALRDLPNVTTDLANLVWPEPPAAGGVT